MKKIKMSESAYIAGTDLARVLGAKDLLREIVPANSPYISAKDYQKVMLILSKWSDDLFKVIDVAEDEA